MYLAGKIKRYPCFKIEKLKVEKHDYPYVTLKPGIQCISLVTSVLPNLMHHRTKTFSSLPVTNMDDFHILNMTRVVLFSVIT